MKMVIQVGIISVFVFILNLVWTESSFVLKPIIVGLFSGGTYYITDKFFKTRT
jgi:hypothetical protein